MQIVVRACKTYFKEIVRLIVLNSNSYQRTAQAQTHEGNIRSTTKQIVRKPKAQSEVEDEFDFYLAMMDYLKQMEPCIRGVARAVSRAIVKHTVNNQYSLDLLSRAQSLILIFSDCKKIIHPVAQSEIETGQMLPNESAAINDPSLAEVNVIQRDVTTQLDEARPHQPPTSISAIPRFLNSNMLSTHDEFFERPIVVDNKEWTSTQTIWSDFGSWEFPKALFKSPLVNKMALIQFFRPDIEVEIVCNSTKFHYGRLVFCVQTLRTTDSNDAYLKAANAFTWPEWYQLSAGINQGIKFTIPYRHVYNQLSINKIASAGVGNMVTVQSYVSAPLQMASLAGSGATVGPAEITILARFKKPRFAGYSINVPTAQSAEAVLLSERGVQVAAKAAQGFTRGIGNAIIGTGQAIKDSAQYLFPAGCSIPPNVGVTNSMQIRQPLYNKIEDCPNTIVLGPSSAASLDKSGSFVNQYGNDMNINTFIGRPALKDTIKLGSGASYSKGKHLMKLLLNPHYMQFSGEGHSDGVGSKYPLPVCYVAQCFKRWRGSFRIHFSAVTSAFHSCRLRIWYQPGEAGSYPTEDAAGLIQSSHLRNILWDINQTSDVSIEVPYETIKNWMKDSETSGVIGLTVVNPLTSANAAGTVTPIYIQVFVTPCNDFQFNDPFVRSSTSRVAPDLKLTQGEVEDSCTIPASSAACLKEVSPIFFGDQDHRQRLYRDAGSVVYTSLKQLINMLTPIEKYESKSTDTNNISGRQYTPYGYYNAFDYNDNFWLAPIHYFTAAYRFARGSFRAHVLVNDTVQVTAYVSSLSSLPRATDTYNKCPLNGTSTELEDLSSAYKGFAYFPDIKVFPADVTLPYFHDLEAIPLHHFGAINYQDDAITIACSTQKSAKTMILFVGGGDDYMLGSMLSIPRLRYGAKTAALRRSLGEDKWYAFDGTNFFVSVGEDFVKCAAVPDSLVTFKWGPQGWLSRPISGGAVIIMDMWDKYLNKIKQKTKNKRSIIDHILEHKDDEGSSVDSD